MAGDSGYKPGVHSPRIGGQAIASHIGTEQQVDELIRAMVGNERNREWMRHDSSQTSPLVG